jgi:hypothetical protein
MFKETQGQIIYDTTVCYTSYNWRCNHTLLPVINEHLDYKIYVLHITPVIIFFNQSVFKNTRCHRYCLRDKVLCLTVAFLNHGLWKKFCN